MKRIGEKRVFDFTSWRTSLDISQGKAARLMGIAQPTYSRMEKTGLAWPVYIWAAKGVTAYLQEQRAIDAQETKRLGLSAE